MVSPPHADEAKLRALTRGELARDEAYALSQHLLDCDECAARLEHVEADPAPRRNVGRYVVLDEVGRGGMGRVLRAWDPQLERFVAIKRLLDKGLADPTGTAQARLLREAQAMAKLVHPNLVAVFDAGVNDGDVYLVMEFIKGPTLHQWLELDAHDWRDVVRLFIQAGRGLAAAHAAGLVHRDFKPSNVLVQDGVARVTDFGLALAANAEPLPPGVESHDGPPSSTGVSSRVTRAGVNAGTPEYMAPEQFRGRFDARSDQFSFARSLEQALVKHKPPRWVTDALRRALSPDPAQRWPAMEPLLDALSPERRARRALVVQAAILGVALLGGAIAFSASRRVDCTIAEAPVQSVWSSTTRTQLSRALASLPELTTQHTLSAFDAWAQTWSTQSRASCEATASGQQSEKIELLKKLCLERRLAFFTTVLAQTSTLSPESVVRVASELPAVDCSDAELVNTGATDESEELRATLQPVRLELGRVEALLLAGQDKQAVTLVEPLLVRARDIGFGPVVAEAALLLGQGLREVDLARSRAAFEESLRAIGALQSVNVSTAQLGSRVALDLIDTWRSEAATFEALWPVVEGAGARAGGGVAWESAKAMARGRSAQARGDVSVAVDEMKKSYELRRSVAGDESERTLVARMNYAVALESAGRSDEAVEHFAALYELNRKLYGPRSLLTARALSRQGSSEVMAVRYAAARQHLTDAKALFLELAGRDAVPPDVDDNLASLMELAGDFTQALPLRHALLALQDDPPVRAKYQALLSRTLLETGDAAGARREASAARETLSHINPTHPDLLVALTTLGRLTPGAEGNKLLDAALALPDARDPEYRGDALWALAQRASSAEQKKTLTQQALQSYVEGDVGFRVEALKRALGN